MRIERFAVLGLMLFCAAQVHADPLSFSWVGVSATSLHPDQGTTGHGGTLDLSYALSKQAFMYASGAQQDFDAERDRLYRFGVGIGTDPSAGYVVYATVGWNHAGADFTGAPGKLDHGWDAGAGIRALLAPRWEVYAGARYMHNDVLDYHAEGDAGVRYALSPRWTLGAGVEINPDQTAYLLNLRVYY